MQVSTKDNQCLVISDYNGGKHQQWKMTPTPNKNWSFLVSMLNNHALDIGGLNKDNGAKVIVWNELHGNVNQQWSLTSEGYIISAMNNKCLDIAGANMNNNNAVHMWDRANVPHQKWQLEPCTPLHVIRCAKEKSLLLTANSKPGESLQLRKNLGNATQHWRLVPSKSNPNQFHIVLASTGACLDGYGWGKENGSKVGVYHELHEGKNQMWTISSEGYIISVWNDLCLDVAGANVNDGGIVHLWQKLNLAHQKWILEKV